MKSDIQAIAESERQLAAAHLSLDLDAIDRLLHPDYLILQPGGRLEGKAELLASLRSGERHWHIAHCDQLVIRLYGDTGIATGLWRAAGTNAGQEFDYQARFISVWIKVGRRWQNIAYQSIEF